MSREAAGYAPGKAILLGEHAVVAGHLAIAAALDRGVRVTLRRRPGPTALEGGRADERLAAALARALPARGLSVRIEAALPPGCGLGSSAALSIALLRARAALEDRPWTPEALHRAGFELERIFHGQPSGIDHAVAARGGALAYRRGEPPRRLAMRPLQAVVVESGTAGDTAEMVRRVAARRPGVDPVLHRLGLLAEAGLAHLDDPEALGPLLDEAHARLGELGVSTPRLDAIAACARRAGALGAKLSGAGGGGVVIALARDEDAARGVIRAVRAAGWTAWPCRLPALADTGPGAR